MKKRYAIQFFNDKTWVTAEFTFTNDPAQAFITTSKHQAAHLADQMGSQAEVVEVVRKTEASR